MGLTFPMVFASWTNNKRLRLSSTSGGLFSELAKLAISQGYAVAGARYLPGTFMVVHDLIEDTNGIGALRQSKYVKSDMSGIREKMRGKRVLFVGSPCQAASVKADIKIDFVCRGSNYPLAYSKYLEMLRSQYESEISRVWFKNKTYGWHKFSTRVDFENGKTYLKDRSKDLYMQGYIKHNLYIMPACYNCKFRKSHHDTDITLGDFWGVRKKYDNNMGTSLVIINNSKGLDFFRELKEADVFRAEASMQEAIAGNWCILNHPIRNPKGEKFMRMLESYSFDEAFRKIGIDT